MKRSILFLLCLSFCLMLHAEEQIVVIKNAKIYTMSGSTIENGSIVIRNGVISEVGNVQSPSGAQEIDALGKSVYPGFIDSNCRVGLQEVNQVAATVDSSEDTDPVTPQLNVVDAFYPDSKTIAVTRSNGITAGVVSPDDENVITGMSALIEFSEGRIDTIVLKSQLAVHATLGEAPKSTYGARNKMPSTRMGTAAVLREAFQKAREYDVKWKEYEKKKQNPSKAYEKSKEPQIPERNLKSEALLQVLEGKIPFVVSAHRADDILTALRIAEEFGIQQNLVVNHGTEAYKIARILAQKKIPVIVGPVTTQPDRMETLGARYDNAALLQKAGVLIAFQSNDAHNARNLPYEAGLAVANGLPYDEALKALTINPAKIFHIDQVGSIEKGKRANLFIANGDPLEPKTAIERIFIGGVQMPQENYHKELWEDFQKHQKN
ncbi:MAG TPA: amidohydrolase family protein [Acidobacteriota bacterium]|nr:amidohydrolase family protein [Acidobacteriota bacterium]